MASETQAKPQKAGEPVSVPAGGGSSGGGGCPPHVLEAIYGSNTAKKSELYEASLKSWWTEYADRKNDEEEEHVADT